MLYRVKGVLHVGTWIEPVNDLATAADPDGAVGCVEDRYIHEIGRCDCEWLDGPEVEEAPADLEMVTAGAPRLPGMEVTQ